MASCWLLLERLLWDRVRFGGALLPAGDFRLDLLLPDLFKEPRRLLLFLGAGELARDGGRELGRELAGEEVDLVAAAAKDDLGMGLFVGEVYCLDKLSLPGVLFRPRGPSPLYLRFACAAA